LLNDLLNGVELMVHLQAVLIFRWSFILALPVSEPS
jgi:hypothetical protein